MNDLECKFDGMMVYGSVVYVDMEFNADLEEATRLKVKLHDDYAVRKEGGVVYTPHHLIEEQRALIWSFVKQAGMSMLSGGSLTGCSLPVAMSEPQSLLQRIASEFSYAPVFLNSAFEAKNPVDRMKNVIAFVVAGLHRSIVNQKKPFNPILGETFQGSFYDGTQIFFEQTSHHPPVSNWDVESVGKWRLTGCGECTASVYGGNSINCGRSGFNLVTFADGTRIKYTQPSLVVGGLMFGSRTMEYLGEMEVVDEKNGLNCHLKFDCNAKKGWFGSSSGVTDLFKGSLCKDKDKTEICKVTGSWIENLLFDDVVFWDLKSMIGYEIIPHPNPLPSDSTLRTDLKALASGNVELAQQEKERLEHLQRTDAKLRKKSGKSCH